MPGGYENMLYSFNLGPAHFISISTEFYYFLYYGIKPVVLQYEWLVNDLKVNLYNIIYYLHSKVCHVIIYFFLFLLFRKQIKLKTENRDHG